MLAKVLPFVLEGCGKVEVDEAGVTWIISCLLWHSCGCQVEGSDFYVARQQTEVTIELQDYDFLDGALLMAEPLFSDIVV